MAPSCESLVCFHGSCFRDIAALVHAGKHRRPKDEEEGGGTWEHRRWALAISAKRKSNQRERV
ncbi:Uncharacterized protein DAT39_015927 [Clarias magur]|uniref:Uncharacterized protein n=1 Tax=Clarias magur TaxID=1594786 RepID=A0A8J4UF59_CLAMG|nr:Uncharacterized protein DAT39_015927 [Clarias magur]